MAMVENTRIDKEREEFWNSISAFDGAILQRRKYLSHQAGRKFPVLYSSKIKQSLNAYALFTKDFYSKSEYDKNLSILGFSELHKNDKMAALGELWNGLSDTEKQVIISLIRSGNLKQTHHVK